MGFSLGNCRFAWFFQPFFRPAPLIWAAGLLLPLVAPADAPAVVYRWDASAWLAKYSHTQFSASPITNPDGTTGAKVVVTPRDALNPYNHIVVTSASMKGGNQYTAIITFSVESPTTYPTSFYMFARNTAGNQYDILQTWIGLPGPTRTIALPLDLKDIPGGTWKLWMGISKSGGLNINSLVVYSGLTSDGKSTYVTEAIKPDATPATPLPAGVTEATGFTPFTVTPPSTKGGTITVAPPTYHFIADAPGADASVAVTNQAALQQAINDCKTQHASKLIIPPGDYRLSSANTTTFDGLSDLTIDGQGARLIIEKLTKLGPAIFVVNCTRLQMQNLSLDWDWNVIPIASLAVLSHLSPDKLQCDFTFPDLDAKQTELTRTTPWRSIFGMEPTHLVVNDWAHFVPPKGTVITAGSAPNVLHATFPAPIPLAEGGNYCIRHLYYEMCGFKISDNEDIVFKGVNIYSIPGMGFFFSGANHNFEVVDCNILRAPGSRHPLTTAADGMHVDQSAGNAIFKNCHITGCGDDAMNLHNEVYQGDIQIDPADPTKLTLLHCPPYQLRIKPGDPLEFFNSNYSNLTDSGTPARVTVAATSGTTKGVPQTTVQLTAPAPAGVTAQSIVRNGRLGTNNVLVSDCDIEYSNGRGLLLSAKNATVTGCKFYEVGIPIDLESDIVQPLWTEGRGASNVLIKDNTFENANREARYGGAFIYTNTRMPWGPTTATLYDQISVENNHFLNCPGPAVSLSNASNVLIRSNEIRATENVPNPKRFPGAILLIKSSKIALGGNKWVSELANPPAPAVVYDPATTSGLSLGSNAVTATP